MALSHARFTALYGGLNTMAKKVYEAVPKSEPWGAKQIASELVRLQRNVDFKIVIGCLDTLNNMGLINEPSRGMFQRERLRDVVERTPPVDAKPIEEIAVTQTTQPKKDPEMDAKNKALLQTAVTKAVTPIDRLEKLSQRCALLAKTVKDLASDIGDAAVEIQQQMDAKDENLSKLRQLQALMRSLGADDEKEAA